MKSTRAPSSSRGVQWGLSEMPDVATQAHRGPRSQGSDHGSKSQRTGTEKRAGERLLPSRSNSTRKGTHHVVKRPDQAGRRGPARGPTHLHPTRDTTVNPTTTRSYVEVVRGVAQRSGRPATVRGPPHVTRYILLPRAPTHPPQPPSAQQRHEGEGRGFVLRSPKDGLSAGTWRRKVVMCPRRGNDPASGHPRAHHPPLGRGTSPPAWDGRLDAPGQRRRHLPSSAWTRRREVKQGKSGGSVGTTDQGKGKGRSVVRPMGTVAYRGKGQGKGKGRGEGRLGQGGRGRSKGGEKLMGTTAYGGKGSKGRAANGDRPVGAASCRRDHHTMASCQNPPPPPPPPPGTIVCATAPAWGLHDDRIPGTDQAARPALGGRHGQKSHSGRQVDARGSADACLSWQKVQRREANRRRHRLTEPTTEALCQPPPPPSPKKPTSIARATEVREQHNGPMGPSMACRTRMELRRQ